MAYFEVSERDARALRLAWQCATDLTPEAVTAHQEGALASSLGWPASAVAWRQLADARNEEAAAWA